MSEILHSADSTAVSATFEASRRFCASNRTCMVLVVPIMRRSLTRDLDVAVRDIARLRRGKLEKYLSARAEISQAARESQRIAAELQPKPMRMGAPRAASRQWPLARSRPPARFAFYQGNF